MTTRILIVDDEPRIALTAVDMVEALGYEAIEAHSGAEALEILGSGKKIDLRSQTILRRGCRAPNWFVRRV